MINKVLETFLLEYYKEEITDLLNDDNDSSHVSINLNLATLKQQQQSLYKNVISNVWKVATDWDKALLEVQKKIVENGNAFLEPEFQIKENCHVRFVNIPPSDNNLKGNFPTIHDIGLFVQVKGNVIRMAQQRLIECQREYVCTKCKKTFLFEAEYGKLYVFDIPKHCQSTDSNNCRGNLQPKNAFPMPNFCKDYQELRLQEMHSKKKVPLSLLVCLENDLVDICVPGECVTICGTLEFRRRPFVADKTGEVVLTLRAVSISKDEKKVNLNKDYSEKMVCVRAQWEDDCNAMGQLNARDLIIRSICPEIYGMYLVKLSLALSLCSGMDDEQSTGSGVTKRGNSHLLLIGDAGLAKSNLLKSASKIAVRSVHTTGLGCSAAGLTAAAIRDEGEIQLEAGALVLADGGVCCIDEFNLMREHDKASIHEAMEQQTISIAKAGLVSNLNARCVILAAANPRCLHTMSDSEGSLAMNTGIASPLLSRFDLIFLLRDERNPDWDARVADHLLKIVKPSMADQFWNIDRLQSHFLAAHEIKPKLSPEAHLIVGSYYKLCRSDCYRDPSRTSVRLLDSLNRLAQSHARLMLRSEVLGIDAVIIVRLMESTWGFGSLLTPMNVIKKDFPLGPDNDEIGQVLNVLGLHSLEPKLLEQLQCLRRNYLPNDSVWKNCNDSSNQLEKDKKRQSGDNIANDSNWGHSSERTVQLENEKKRKTGDKICNISNSRNSSDSTNELENVKKRKSGDNIANISNLEKLFGYHNQPKRVKVRTTTDEDEISCENNWAPKQATSKIDVETAAVNSTKVLSADSVADSEVGKIIHSTPADVEWDDVEWHDDEFDLTLNGLDYDGNGTSEQPNTHETAASSQSPALVKPTQSNVLESTIKPLLRIHSIYDDPDFNEADLELDDDFLDSNKTKPDVVLQSKQDVSNSHQSSKLSILGCSTTNTNNNQKNIKLTTADKKTSGVKVFSSDHSIHYLASQYEDLDFLESD